MKIHKAKLIRLASEIALCLGSQRRFTEIREEYKALGRSEERWRWDLFWAAHDTGEASIAQSLYGEPGIKDAHISTGLRYIIGGYAYTDEIIWSALT